MLLIEVIASLAHNVFHAVKETALLTGTFLVLLGLVFYKVLRAVDSLFNDIASLGDLVLEVIEIAIGILGCSAAAPAPTAVAAAEPALISLPFATVGAR
ncbi:hypothetical protein [Corynebacterium sp. KPL2734]|uniref:hypothetical protein n=1 Tax=Corynebacterium sp. KPL2734 TaxID=3158312 RepID=UPI0032EC8BC9